MTTSISDFRIRFPEFADDIDYPDERVQLFLDDAALLYMGGDEGRWCGKYDVAQSYLAAHLLVSGTASEVGDTGGKSGVVASKSADGVSLAYAVVAKERTDGDLFLSSTIYGQRYIAIRNTCFVGVLTAIGN